MLSSFCTFFVVLQAVKPRRVMIELSMMRQREWIFFDMLSFTVWGFV